jgi:hypothetical protein
MSSSSSTGSGFGAGLVGGKREGPAIALAPVGADFSSLTAGTGSAAGMTFFFFFFFFFSPETTSASFCPIDLNCTRQLRSAPQKHA